MGTKGGKQEGAGRPKGSANKATLARQAVSAAVNQRILSLADTLLNAQVILAVGALKVFRVDEEKAENGKTKKKHVHVTDPNEITELLDKYGGEPGTMNNRYYFFSDVAPDIKAIDSLINRALGKPVEKVELDATVIQVPLDEKARAGKAVDMIQQWRERKAAAGGVRQERQG